MSIKIISMNCQGLANARKRRDVLNYIRDGSYSIICLQDIHASKESKFTFIHEWGLEGVIAPFTSAARGVAVLFNNTIEYKVLKTAIDPGGNYIVLTLLIEGKQVQLVNIYGPNSDNSAFYENIFEQIDFEEGTIFCGDWNLVLDPQKDTDNYININNPKSRDTVLGTINEHALIDSYRIQHPNSRRFTWRKAHPRKQSRLDFFLVSEDIHNLVVKADIIPGYRTDHSAITLSMNLTEKQKGSGYWKMNNSLLRDKQYVDLVKETIKETVGQYAASPYARETLMTMDKTEIQFNVTDQTFLDMILMNVRSKTISYSTWRKKDRKKKEASLEEEIAKVERELDQKSDEDEKERMHLRQLKRELEDIREEKINGIMMRSRARWYEQGEKPTKYFCNLEKRRYINKTIQRLKVEGREIEDTKEIITEQRKYYANLYAFRENDSELTKKTLNNLNLPSLNEESAESLEGPLTITELANAVRSMNNDKVPGLDGFPVDFFKFFWSDLNTFILRAINEAYDTGIFSTTQRRGVITCLPKPQKDRSLLSNWRPITLLSTVYKMASKCISNRIQTVIDTLIHTDQTGFLKGRNISDNVRLLYDILHETKEQNLPGAILLIDFEKAFDSVSLPFILSTMQRFGFKDSIQKWVKLFYEDINACIIQNGYLSQSFPINRGCRQGDPIAPYIFLLSVEVMGQMIRENDGIRGINLYGKEYKICQYADDTQFILDGSDASLRTTLNTLHDFFKMSGLKVNIEKTKAIGIGRSRLQDRNICPDIRLTWEDANFKILGIQLNSNLQNIVDINYTDKVKEIANLLAQWKARHLSLMGKITVIKSLALSKLTHLISALPNPEAKHMKALTTLFYKFIWNGGPDKISRKTLCQDYVNGGLRMVNLQGFVAARKISWLKRLQSGKSSWRHLIGSILEHVDKAVTFTNMGGRYLQRLQAKLSNPFWQDVFKAWECYHNASSDADYTPSDILSEPLWYNKYAKNDFIKQWYKRGMIFICDLVKEDGNLKTFDDCKIEFGVTGTALNYENLKRSLPKRWIRTIQNAEELKYQRVEITRHMKILIVYTQGIKSIYKTISSAKESPKVEKKWNLQFADNLNWKEIYLAAGGTSMSSYIHSFQYKLIHQITCTNSLLYKMKIKQTDLCDSCNSEKETITHLFVNCPRVVQFWEDLRNWIELTTANMSITTRTKDILFGYSPEQSLKNLILTLGKSHVYRCKFDNQMPSLNMFIHKLRNHYSIEKYVAQRSGDTQKFRNKWSCLARELETYSN